MGVFETQHARAFGSKMARKCFCSPQFDTQNLVRLIAKYPWTLACPLLVLAVIVGLGVWGLSYVASGDIHGMKSLASSLALEAAAAYRQQLTVAASPLLSLAALVHLFPQYDNLLPLFGPFSASVAQLLPGQPLRSLQLAPAGVVRLVAPLQGNQAALGLDVFAVASEREGALKAAADHVLTLVGPMAFKQGGSGVRIRLPIFANVSGSSTSNGSSTSTSNGSNSDGNVTAWGPFGLPDPVNPYCGEPCKYNAATEMMFWGFATALIDLTVLGNSSDSRLLHLAAQGYRYRLTAPGMPTSAGASASRSVIAATEELPRDAVEAVVDLPNTQWLLEISPASGHWTPAWYVPLLAVVVVVGVALAALQFAVLVSRRQHQMLLEALLPREMIKDLVSRDATALGPRAMQADTPADVLLKLLGQLLEGDRPDIRDVLMVRTAVLRNLDIYQPVNLGSHIKGANLDADVTRALMRQLGGTLEHADLLYDDVQHEDAALAAAEERDVQIIVDGGDDVGGGGDISVSCRQQDCSTLTGALALILTPHPAIWYDNGGADATDGSDAAHSDAALPTVGAECALPYATELSLSLAPISAAAVAAGGGGPPPPAAAPGRPVLLATRGSASGVLRSAAASVSALLLPPRAATQSGAVTAAASAAGNSAAGPPDDNLTSVCSSNDVTVEAVAVTMYGNRRHRRSCSNAASASVAGTTAEGVFLSEPPSPPPPPTPTALQPPPPPPGQAAAPTPPLPSLQAHFSSAPTPHAHHSHGSSSSRHAGFTSTNNGSSGGMQNPKSPLGAGGGSGTAAAVTPAPHGRPHRRSGHNQHAHNTAWLLLPPGPSIANGNGAAAAAGGGHSVHGAHLGTCLSATYSAGSLGLPEERERPSGRLFGSTTGGMLQSMTARRQAMPPPPAVLEEVEKLLAVSDGWQFNTWKLREATQGHPLSALGFYLLQRAGLVARFKMNPVTLARLLRHIEAGYPDNPYHNATHAADVLQTLHVIVHGGQLIAHYLDPLGLLATYFAAIIHDYGHPGLTNDFLIATSHPLALRYNDRSPLENHHAAAALTAVLRRPELDVLGGLTQQERAAFRKQVIEMVLSTDMKQHFALLAHFNTVHRLGSYSAAAAASAASGNPASPLLLQRSSRTLLHPSGPSMAGAQRGAASDLSPRPRDDTERLLGLQIALKAADLGHLGEELGVHQRWLGVLEEEFFNQGDQERRLGLPISPLFDRAKQGVSKSQVGFYDFVALPLVHALSSAFPGCLPLMRCFLSNYNHWRLVDGQPPVLPHGASTAAAATNSKLTQTSSTAAATAASTAAAAAAAAPATGTAMSSSPPATAVATMKLAERHEAD